MDAYTNRLRKNQRHLRKWAKRRGLTAYRLYDHDIPEHPAIVERYGDAVVLWHVPRFADDEMLSGELERATLEALELKPENLFVKVRKRQAGDEQYQRRDGGAETRIVEEGDLLFGVNLSDYLDTGLFLDQRLHRAKIREVADGMQVLNLFAYTGSFSVAAAAGGAAHVTTVDMSSTYLAWAEDNFELNAQSLDRHECIQSDVFGFLRDAVEDGLQYDVIVCDPPTFSNSKRMIGTLDIQRDHTGLLNLAGRLLRPHGHLFFSTNRRKFRLQEDELNLSVEEKWTPHGIPEDFRNRTIHQAWWLARPSHG